MYNIFSTLSIFRNFTAEELADIEQIGKKQFFESNTDIIREGELSDDFFIILDGKVAVLKYVDEESNGMQFPLVTLSKSDVFGEMAFVDHLPRSSTVRTIEPTTVLRMTKESIATAKHGDEIHKKLTSNIAQTSIQRLREFNSQYVNKLQETLTIMQNRHQFGIFCIGIFCSFSILSVLEYIFKIFHYDVSSNWSTVVKLVLVCIPAYYFIWKFKISWKNFGVTWNQWQESVMEGVIIGTLLSIGAVAIDSLYLGVPFSTEAYQVIKDFRGGSWLIIYPLLAYLQEFMARGVIQSSAQKFLNDRQGFYAIFVTAVFFAGMHIYRGWQFVFMAFLAGLFMGIIYVHRQNLIGVSIVHSILGLIYLPISEKYLDK